MPYTPPADAPTRNHHRSRSFTQEKGPGAFAPLAHIPRRAKAPPTFHLKGSSSESDDDDDELNDASTKSDSIPFPTLASPSHSASFPSLNLPRAASTPQLTPSEPTPSIYRSPYTSGTSSPTVARKPLKPSLKSNHSSPHLPSLAGNPHTRILTQSAPTTPHLHPNNSGASTPSSPGDDGPYSALPQTPKQVHFAAEKSSLESVVVFNKTARPRSLSTGNDTETETEGYDSSSNAWGANRYPFPAMPKQEDQSPQVVLDDAQVAQVPSQSSIGNGGFAPGSTADKRFVYLETLMLPGSKPPTLKGSILVRNVAFQKRVAVRFTMDDWQTVSEVSCTYSASLPSLPPPFAFTGTNPQPSLDGGESYANPPLSSHSRAASLNSIMSAVPPTGRVDSWDRFTFTIKLEDVERTLVSKKILLVVRYTVPSQWGWECGGEWWDNNDTKNYLVAFKYGKKASTTSSADTESTTMRAARSKQDEIRRQTASLPPLPPPGPIRSMNLPGLNTLRAKVDKEGLLPPPMLRQGRAATFKENAKLQTESPPPGSPTQRVFPKNSTTNSPTVSPVNSAVWGSGGLLGTPPTSMYQAPPQPEPAVQESKPPSLSISTSSVNVSPPLSTGKAKRLSLSNYASPVSKTHSEHPSRTPSFTSSSDSSAPSPVTPGTDTLGLKVVGGMPATMVFQANIEMNGSQTLPRRGFPLNGRIGSWDGIWGGDRKSEAKKIFEHKPAADDIALIDSLTDPLPTPPDSSSSATSTPDLERSPDLTPRIDLPQLKEENPVVVSAADAGKDSIPFPAAESPIEPLERPMSNLARRTSMGTIKLEMPTRQMFAVHRAEENDQAKGTPPAADDAIPVSSPRGSDSGASSTATEIPATSSTAGLLSPSNSSSSIASLSKSDDSPSLSGPPAEFLAKYCFFVSSPSTSPPVPAVPRSGIRQPGYSSPSGAPIAFGAGIDTPRASSPGLSSVPPAWWGGAFSPPVLSAGDGDRSRT